MSTTKSKMLEVTIEVDTENIGSCRPEDSKNKGCQFHAYYSESDYAHCCLFNAPLGDSLGGAMPRCIGCHEHFGV